MNFDRSMTWFRRANVFCLGLIAMVTAGVPAMASRAVHTEAPRPLHRKFIVTINLKAAPDVRPWAHKAKKLVLGQIGNIEHFLSGKDYKPVRVVHLVFNDKMKGIAYTTGNTIHVSGAYIKRHPNDLGLVDHELVHVVQEYHRRGPRPGWLVEGIADYVRYYRYEPGLARSHFNPRRVSYKRGYQPAAGLLHYITVNYNKNTVPILNRALRQGRYNKRLIQRLADGKTFPQLWKAYKTSLLTHADNG